jgi:hypothetical protein
MLIAHDVRFKVMEFDAAVPAYEQLPVAGDVVVAVSALPD